MRELTESTIEFLTIELLENQGYHYIYGPDIQKQNENQAVNILLTTELKTTIDRLNPEIPPQQKTDALQEIHRIHASPLIDANETFHRMLTEGINITLKKDNEQRGDYVKLIDFENPDNNTFHVVNQLTIIENHHQKRPDLILYINGLPLVVIELKDPTDENATIKSAYQQLETYKDTILSLFIYNALLIVSDGLDARVGTISSKYNRFMQWKSIDGKTDAAKNISQIETLISGMLNKKTLLDLIRNFIVFEKTKKEDAITRITQADTIKKIAAYHQYYAVNKALESVMKASSEKGDRKGGVIWHTQGSGKSLSMVFSAGKIVSALNNPTILIITDRNDLDDQLFDTFAACKQLLRQNPVQADDRRKLKILLKVECGGIIFTTIQKFQTDGGNIYDELSARRNIVVIADEAHRTQYGFAAKTIDDKDENGNIIGKKTVYGFAKYMRDALPNATYLGFTGTPIEGADINTPAVFGGYVDVYDIAQAVSDGATVRIFYESRLAKVSLSDEGKKLVEEIDQSLSQQAEDSENLKSKSTRLEALIGSDNRIQQIANDIVQHFEARQSVLAGKGMIVSMSRRIAVKLYDAIIKLKPEWHSDDLNKGMIKVVMTADSSDGPDMCRHHTTKTQRRALADRVKNPDDELKLVIVRDMWLTGFDAPCLHTLYIDKPMQGHNLMQAIARVNRVYKDKEGGLIVDYLGIASDLKKALSFYADSGGKGDPMSEQAQAVSLMLEKLEIASQILHGFNYEPYFTASTSQKLSLILSAEEHILGLDNGKKRFIDQVTALSRAFAIAIPHDAALDLKDHVAFFQAIKARLVKFESRESEQSNEETETAIRQIIDGALVSHQTIDIFDAAGIKKPDLSILSEEFLIEIKNMPHKNIALETLKKLLNDEIKSRSRKNLIQSKSLIERLEASIKRYQNKILTASEVIDELIKLSKDIQSMDTEHQKLGLSDYEYAFYSAVANNDSAMELMGKDKLRELAVVLAERVKSNASLDWTIKESVRAKIRKEVKRALNVYGYPPDMQLLATDNVLKQAEMISAEITE